MLPTSWTRRAQQRAAAREDGERAAGLGLSLDVCRFAEGTELRRSWDAGWRDGMRKHSEVEYER
jgi:ribosome modulation factor